MKSIKEVFEDERKMLIGFLNDSEKSFEQIVTIRNMAIELHFLAARVETFTGSTIYSKEARQELLDEVAKMR